MEKRALPDSRRCGDLCGCGLGVAFLQKERHCCAQHLLLGQKAAGLFPPRHVITSYSGSSLLGVLVFGVHLRLQSLFCIVLQETAR